MYIFLFTYYGGGGSGHAFKQIIADSEKEAREVHKLDIFWHLETCFELKNLYDTEITWQFEFFDEHYEG